MIFICAQGCGKLRQYPLPSGFGWHCHACDGISINLAVVRRLAGRSVAKELFLKATQSTTFSSKDCPSCERRLSEVHLRNRTYDLELDICRPCQLVWFDGGELETIPMKEAGDEPCAVEQAGAIAQVYLSKDHVDHMDHVRIQTRILVLRTALRVLLGSL